MKLSKHTSDDSFILYEIESEEMTGFIEAQFDDGEFNGTITFSDIEEPDEWAEVKSRKVFREVKNQAIKDYKEEN